MSLDMAGVDDRLAELWREYKPDYPTWSYEALKYLAERFQVSREADDPRLYIQSTRVLFGRGCTKFGSSALNAKRQDGDYEEVIGDLVALATGIVFLRAVSENWWDLGGRLFRYRGTAFGFALNSITNTHSSMTITERDDGSAEIKLPSGIGHDSGCSHMTILPDRWAALKSWLNQWLPEEA